MGSRERERKTKQTNLWLKAKYCNNQKLVK